MIRVMKITIATGLYPPEIGGPATYVKMLETKLPAAGVEITTVPFGWVRHYPKVMRHFIFAWKLWQNTKHADIIYALDPISVGVPSLFVSKLRRKPFIIRLGGDYAWEQGRIRFGLTETLDEYLEKKDKSPLNVRLFSKVQTYVVGKALRVIVPSEYLKSVVMKWGIDEDKIQVIYSALYPLYVSDTRAKLRAELNYSQPTIMSAGRLVPWKGFEVLIRVVGKLRERYPDISLVLAGDGEDKVKLEDLVATLGLSEIVHFTGNLSKDALGATIKAADVFVLNTAYEGLSHQLIEVMDVGTPIVSTHVGGNTELILNEVNGFLVEFNNTDELEEAISRVLNHPESRERIVQSARLRSKEFSKEKAVDKIVKMLEEIHDITKTT